MPGCIVGRAKTHRRNFRKSRVQPGVATTNRKATPDSFGLRQKLRMVDQWTKAFCSSLSSAYGFS